MKQLDGGGLALSFEDERFELVHAHGGREPILFCRARMGAADTAHNFLDLTIVPPGGEIGRHTHAQDNEETYIVVSGSGWMEQGGERFPVGPGSIIVNPPGGTHALTNPGPDDLRIVVIELKAGRGGI
jgi:mannose-6-phosphate isomerase-like protein (cupin superfamily)